MKIRISDLKTAIAALEKTGNTEVIELFCEDNKLNLTSSDRRDTNISITLFSCNNSVGEATHYPTVTWTERLK